MSLGEDRVRVKFNPSDNSTVSQIKQKTAELINLVNNMELPKDSPNYSEFIRLRALPMTSYEEAAMWAVKAETI